MSPANTASSDLHGTEDDLTLNTADRSVYLDNEVEKYGLQELREKNQVFSDKSTEISDSEVTETEENEHKLKTLFYAKVNDTVGDSTKARAALQQMVRVQSGTMQHNQSPVKGLEQYKALLRKLTKENSILKQQLALLRDSEQSTSASNSSDK